MKAKSNQPLDQDNGRSGDSLLGYETSVLTSEQSHLTQLQ
jgi:hypothetical protein